MLAIDLSKEQKLDFNPKAIKKSRTGNLEQQVTISFIIEEAEETL